MSIRIGVVMDPIADIHVKKDSTLAMLYAAQERGWEIFYFEQKDLFLNENKPYGNAAKLRVSFNPENWFTFEGRETIALSTLNVILMRKDPPVDESYIYTTYLLEHAERLGVLIVNHPQSLRDANEKMFATFFPEFTPPTLVTQSVKRLYDFWLDNKDIVCKPLNAMGGRSVFRIKEGDVNINTILDVLTQGGSNYIMAQVFIPEIVKGDKRILLINGEPIPHALARMPQAHDWHGNLATGAKGIVQPLTQRDRAICNAVGPVVRDMGLHFVGIDVIGDYLTEINVTSPTCIREIDAGAKINVSSVLMDFITAELTTS